jgi:hypothetical protein
MAHGAVFEKDRRDVFSEGDLFARGLVVRAGGRQREQIQSREANNSN